MAWETRGGRGYYYRSEWVGGRSVKRYCGGGPLGALAEGVEQQARERRRDEAAAAEAQRSRLRPLDGLMDALDEACGTMLEAALTAAGYRRVNYAWRRRRARPNR